MPGPTIAYVLFGLALSGLLAWVIVHYYARRRHDQIEEAKYRMLDDDQ